MRRPGTLAEAALAANPSLSNRLIADAAEIDEGSVRYARRKNPAFQADIVLCRDGQWRDTRTREVLPPPIRIGEGVAVRGP
jgi:hypothetical protein